MNGNEIPKQLSSILSELDEIENVIKTLRKEHEEDVEESRSKLADIKNGFINNGFRLYLSYRTADLDTKENLDSLLSFIGRAKRNIRALRLFAFSEIIHRKLQEIEFKFANPFLLLSSKKEYRRIKYELADLDDKASSAKGETDIHDFIEGYEKLIKDVKILIDDLNEEKTSGILSSLGKIILWAIAPFFTFYAFSNEDLMLDKRFIGLTLVIIIFGFLLLVLRWNYLSYGMKAISKNRSFAALFFIIGLILSIYALLGYFHNLVDFLIRSTIIFGFFFLIGLYQGYNFHKKYLLKKDLEALSEKFFSRNGV